MFNDAIFAKELMETPIRLEKDEEKAIKKHGDRLAKDIATYGVISREAQAKIASMAEGSSEFKNYLEMLIEGHTNASGHLILLAEVCGRLYGAEYASPPRHGWLYLDLESYRFVIELNSLDNGMPREYKFTEAFALDYRDEELFRFRQKIISVLQSLQSEEKIIRFLVKLGRA